MFVATSRASWAWSASVYHNRWTLSGPMSDRPSIFRPEMRGLNVTFFWGVVLRPEVVEEEVLDTGFAGSTSAAGQRPAGEVPIPEALHKIGDYR